QGKIPGVEAITRLFAHDHVLRHGRVRDSQSIYSADPNVFDLLRLPVLYGDLAGALARPDAIVIPLSLARKYFGADNVVGQSLTVDNVHPLAVTAVIADLPVHGSVLAYGSQHQDPDVTFMSSKTSW